MIFIENFNNHKKNNRESIKEDDDGLVESAIIEIIQKAKRKRQLKKRGHRKLGMMRHVYLIVDCSESMSFPDLKPTRMLCTVKVNIYNNPEIEWNPKIYRFI